MIDGRMSGQMNDSTDDGMMDQLMERQTDRRMDDWMDCGMKDEIDYEPWMEGFWGKMDKRIEGLNYWTMDE